jgi:hypothetical protein
MYFKQDNLSSKYIFLKKHCFHVLKYNLIYILHVIYIT